MLYRISLETAEPFALAGLWRREDTPTGDQDKFVIITVPPSKEIGRIHDRMPAIILPGQKERWLDHETQTDKLLSLLQPFAEQKIKVKKLKPTAK